LTSRSGQPLSAADVVDHDKSWSIYFNDPYGNPFEITTYDYETVRQQLSSANR
jgi:catechol-2,3-dioxygenase